MKRELIRKVVFAAIEKGIIANDNLDPIERAEEVTNIVQDVFLADMKSGIKAELESYADELEKDLSELGLNEKEVGQVYADFMATFTNVMDLLDE